MPTGFGGGLPPPYRPAAAPPEVFAQAVDALLRHAENLDQDTLQAVQARHRALLAEAATTLSKMAGARGGKATRTKQERDAGKRGLPRVASLEDVDDAFKQLRRDHQFKDPALQASASADDRRHLAVVVDDMRKKAARQNKDMWSNAFVAWYLEHWQGLDLAPATGVYTQPLLEEDGRGGVRRVKASDEKRGRSYQKVLADLYYRLPGLQEYIQKHLPEMESELSSDDGEALELGQKRAAGVAGLETDTKRRGPPESRPAAEPESSGSGEGQAFGGRGVCRRAAGTPVQKYTTGSRQQFWGGMYKRPRTTSDTDADFVFKPGICQRKQLNQALNERIAAQRKRGQEQGVINIVSSSDDEDSD